jgi:hypothetical protein
MKEPHSNHSSTAWKPIRSNTREVLMSGLVIIFTRVIVERRADPRQASPLPRLVAGESAGALVCACRRAIATILCHARQSRAPNGTQKRRRTATTPRTWTKGNAVFSHVAVLSHVAMLAGVHAKMSALAPGHCAVPIARAIALRRRFS